jgi:hypothetical protein
VPYNQGNRLPAGYTVGSYFPRIKVRAAVVDILLDVIKVALIPIVILAMPILFVLVLDIAAHLRELFGGR